MKKTITLLTMLILLQVLVKAQTVTYTYDASGNRIHRTLSTKKLSSPQKNTNDSTITVANDIQSIIAEDTNISSVKGVVGGENGNVNGITALNEGDINVFPNPVQDKINVQFNGSVTAEGCSLQLYDGAAKLFFKTDAMQKLTEVNMHEAKAGIYYLVVVSKEGKRLYWKVVKE